MHVCVFAFIAVWIYLTVAEVAIAEVAIAEVAVAVAVAVAVVVFVFVFSLLQRMGLVVFRIHFAYELVQVLVDDLCDGGEDAAQPITSDTPPILASNAWKQP